MAELQAALGVLASGKAIEPIGTPRAASSPAAAPGREGWFVPPHLLRLPAVRTWAFTAHDASREAAAHPEDFDKVYRFGLSLQVGGRTSSEKTATGSLCRAAPQPAALVPPHRQHPGPSPARWNPT